MVYTLNPYTPYAPRPWNQVKSSNANINNKRKPTLYGLQYPKDSEHNYKNIDFDKTQHLDGHEIKLMVSISSKILLKSYNLRNVSAYMKFFEKFKDVVSMKDFLIVSMMRLTLGTS
ncbi:uncharacterized protein LOC141525377 [Cotesia typhae]|uniref:uncharacterized protein LOC141525377 n=1 Tax=Cotesia typhae TaxID=2053667 RepID=UPI003D693CE7